MNKREMIRSVGFKLGAISIIASGIGVGRSLFTEAQGAITNRNVFPGITKFASVASANTKRNSATWQVPPGITKIRVRSWNPDGSKDLDRTLNVEPNQVFRIDAIED